jgi:hypothetical protein
VFRDEAAWCAFWAQASGALIPVFPQPVPVCPAVDFRRHVVIATVGAGGGCNGSHIAAVDRVGSRRAVEVLVEHSYLIPGGGCGCTADFHVDAHAVVVARPIGDAEFVHESVGFECPLIPNHPSRSSARSGTVRR